MRDGGYRSFVFGRFVSGTHVRKSQRRRIIMSVEILRAKTRDHSARRQTETFLCDAIPKLRVGSLTRSAPLSFTQTKIRLGTKLPGRTNAKLIKSTQEDNRKTSRAHTYIEYNPKRQNGKLIKSTYLIQLCSWEIDDAWTAFFAFIAI
jgi:hypothetical protein